MLSIIRKNQHLTTKNNDIFESCQLFLKKIRYYIIIRGLILCQHYLIMCHGIMDPDFTEPWVRLDGQSTRRARTLALQVFFSVQISLKIASL